MNRLEKLASFLSKTATDSDLTYIILINKIINLFKTKSTRIMPDINIILYRIDLRDLEFYDYTILDPRVFGDYLDIAIYSPEHKDDREENYKKFEAIYMAPSSGRNPTISFFPDPYRWRQYNHYGDILDGLIRNNEGLLKHELTHFLNSTRFLRPRGGHSVSTYGSKNTGEGSFGYVNSTEEVQARIISMISFVMNGLYDGDLNKNLNDLYNQKWLPIYQSRSGTKRDIFLATLIYYVRNNDINSFVNNIFDASYTFYIENENLLDKTKKRYMKRLYDLFETLRNKLQNTKDEDDISPPNIEDLY